MKYSVDFVQPGHALVNGDIPMEAPHLLFRDDRRAIIGEDINGDLVVLQSEEKSKIMTSVNLATLKDLQSNVVDGMLDIDANAPLEAFKVMVDGADAEYLFIESNNLSATSVKALTTVDVGRERIQQAVSAYNQERFPDKASANNLDAEHTLQQGMIR